MSCMGCGSTGVRASTKNPGAAWRSAEETKDEEDNFDLVLVRDVNIDGVPCTFDVRVRDFGVAAALQLGPLHDRNASRAANDAALREGTALVLSLLGEMAEFLVDHVAAAASAAYVLSVKRCIGQHAARATRAHSWESRNDSGHGAGPVNHAAAATPELELRQRWTAAAATSSNSRRDGTSSSSVAAVCAPPCLEFHMGGLAGMHDVLVANLPTESGPCPWGRRAFCVGMGDRAPGSTVSLWDGAPWPSLRPVYEIALLDTAAAMASAAATASAAAVAAGSGNSSISRAEAYLAAERLAERVLAREADSATVVAYVLARFAHAYLASGLLHKKLKLKVLTSPRLKFEHVSRNCGLLAAAVASATHLLTTAVAPQVLAAAVAASGSMASRDSRTSRSSASVNRNATAALGPALGTTI